ncbi:unnamed protein product, partial [Musa acuminata subsp. burmannicoides]
ARVAVVEEERRLVQKTRRGDSGKIEEGFGCTPSSDLRIKIFERSAYHSLRYLN